MMSFGGWGLETSHRSRRVASEASFEDGIAQILYQRAHDICYESPLTFRQTSRKTNAEMKRALEEDTSGRGKYNEYTAEERAQIGKFATEHGSGNLPWNMADDGTPSDYCYSVWVLVTAFSLT